MLPPPSELTQHVLGLCREAGFGAWGVAGVEPSAYERELREWLAAGRQGSMAWLGENLHVKADPGRLLRSARAIVMVAAWYARRGDVDAPVETGKGRVARYARGKDYHKAFKTRLHAVCDRLRAEFPGCECRAFSDIEPMPERELAARAGLGWVGKNTLVIDPRRGSWMALGGFATSLPLVAPPGQRLVADHCGTCTRCIDACPTGAITPWSVDASRCISYLTIENRGPVAAELQGKIGDWAFGCDVCQEVCPHNSARFPSAADGEAAGPANAGGPGGGAMPAGAEIRGGRATLPLLEVLGWTKEDRTRELSGSVIKRATLATLKRNAVIVLGNQAARSGDASMLERLRQLAADEREDALVRETAAGVVRRLDAASAQE
jgi:epoxyqueuosine reductase